MKTIFNTYIEVTSQPQADRLKQVCVDNGLPIWHNRIAFMIYKSSKYFSIKYGEFFVGAFQRGLKVTEPEWMELLTKYKEENGN